MQSSDGRVQSASSSKGFEKARHLDFLHGLPQAIAVVRVDLNLMGQPCDLVPVYGNEALFSLFNTPGERLIGSSIITSYIHFDKKWLSTLWDTAYMGRVQKITDFWPVLGRHLMVTCHQPQHGYCTCLFQDVSERVELEKELEKNRQKVEALLHSAVDMVFQIDPVTHAIANLEKTLTRATDPFKARRVPEDLLQQGLFEPGQDGKISEVVNLTCFGLGNCTCDVRARIEYNEPYTWHSLTVVGYIEPQTGEVRIIGFLKDAHDRIKERDALLFRAEKDSLCGIYNRAAGESLISLKLSGVAETEPTQAAMFIFDLDDFKNINDSAGHSTGDAVLTAFARILRDAFRKDDVVFRLGGDEFATFAQNLPLARVVKIYEKVAAKLAKPIVPGVRVNVCAGVAYSQSGRHCYDDFYKTADKALYNAKEGGKGKAGILCLCGNGS
ncbi:MAG: GGDEF domain-containing protein [Desulfovibrio sp.]|nr:GGDEF domain-containing protein [Desulfovibrio sp.]